MKDGYAEVSATECSGYVGSDLKEKFVINVTAGCNLTLSGRGGADVFKFVSSPRSTATITDFNLEMDRIDLSLFTELRSWRDVSMTAGSVLIHLPDGMTIVLLRHSPSDMTSKHFILHDKNSNSSQDILYAFIYTAVGFFICIVSASLSCCKDPESSSHPVAVAPDAAPDDIENRGSSSAALLSVLGQNKIHPITGEPTQEVRAEGLSWNVPGDAIPDVKSSDDSDADSHSFVSEAAQEVRHEDASHAMHRDMLLAGDIPNSQFWLSALDRGFVSVSSESSSSHEYEDDSD